jgi:hypothetical protein
MASGSQNTHPFARRQCDKNGRSSNIECNIKLSLPSERACVSSPQMLVLADVNVQNQCKFGRLLAMKAVYEAVSGGLNELLTLWDKKYAYKTRQDQLLFYYVHSLEPRGLALPEGTS